MRIDKFLKVTGLIKRRSIAALLCNEGQVLINGKEAKAGREVCAGNHIAISFPRRTLLVEVITIPNSRTCKDEVQNCYRVTDVVNEPDNL